MTVSVNPLRNPLDHLWDRLNLLNGLLFLLEAQLKNFGFLFKSALKKQGVPLERIWGGASLAIRDLTEWPSHGWAEYYPSGGFHAEGEEYVNLAASFIERESAWTIAQAHESFESFGLELLATYFYLARAAAPSSHLAKAKATLTKLKVTPGSRDYWRHFVRMAYRNIHGVLKAIRKIHSLSDLEQKNNRVIDLTLWHSVVTEVRHAAIHANMIVRTARTQGWTLKHLQILKGQFGAVRHTDGFILRPTRKNAELALVLFAEYGYGLFKELSKVAGYSWDILATGRKTACNREHE